MTTPTLPISRKKLWLAAIKPPMYSVAVIPIGVGSAVAFAETESFNWAIFSTFITAAILIIAWLNLTNDVFDSETGIDVNKHHSVVNLTGNKTLVFWIANGLLAIAALELILIAWWQHSPMILELIALAVFLGYTYQGPPFRLGYLGLGEIICFITFGPLAVSAAYYSQNPTWSTTSLKASIIIGLTTSIILLCSHFHQVEDDIAAGKRSPIVRIGTTKGAQLLLSACVAVFAAIALFTIEGYFPQWTALSFLSIPVAVQLCYHVLMYHDQPEQVKNCKFIAVNFHFISGFLLGLGFILG
ncbi:2-carboxy-1,4-naphthoquinone phytyltransferase [Roseofilum reptotaenium CS-1145]|uniref:2-carboxy-1,4-naphthoquinone phytyltransferase n=1 Tax=Roseofilum reptotaenium AO1-A TaxID=1925591 RepID=A0A1L9QLY7_9CYAN|nr:2-carboxy-1,4-naphthoquinone phytyltransferase [Roseofilum reptotaenium]MDB9517430.1 2-carboxy-1,4-naphthoquinone phytyltransferase [Roseofilum reptotaenium CS-1145]OJJ20718.1 1,4-dihydroxy-2-naphthoate phytyltransferase [Roseofilum reptotaenium AO1-A]